MTIFACVSQKGGATKSTTLVNIAAVLASQGKSPVIFDADEQTTAYDWWECRYRDYPSAPIIKAYKGKGDGFLDEIGFLSDNNEYVLIDTAGHYSEEMQIIFEVADINLIPFRCSQADLNTLPYMGNIVKQAKCNRPELKVYVVLSAVKTGTKKTVESARKLISQYPEFILLNTIIYSRVCYEDSISTGLGVIEEKKNTPSLKKAKQEMIELTGEIYYGN